MRVRMEKPMGEYRVAKDGTAPYTSVGAALRAIPGDEPAVIRLGPGEYREKVFSEKKCLTIIGAGRNSTRVVWGDCARDQLLDGLRGTFRSYTAFFDGDSLRLQDLTLANDAGDGEARGQAVAAALHARRVLCRNVAFLGWQDTLFCAPLPQRERQPGGFRGPREHWPRVQTEQLFQRCVISGSVDFIFGGANALFEECELVCRPRATGLRGYVAAPCTPQGELGMVFLGCWVHGGEGEVEKGGGGEPANGMDSDAANGTDGEPVESYALGRPWREDAAAAFIECRLGRCVSPEGFAPWHGSTLPPTVRFFLADKYGEGSATLPRYGQMLTASQRDALLAQAAELRARVEAAWATR